MTRMRRAAARPGFTLVEMLVALTLTAIIGGAITVLFVSQERAFDTQTKLQSARDVTRGARNILVSELRMLDRDSGVVSAAADSISLRVPYAMGVACVSNASLIINLLPVDSAVLAYAAYGGYAVRNFGSGAYTYVAKDAEPASAAASNCTAVLQQLVPGGQVLALSPAVAAAEAPAGAAVLLWQDVTYHFGTSTSVSGRRALFRRAGNLATEEVVAPFASTAHFEFYLDDALTPVTTLGAGDLKRITGFELVLDALSERPQADGTFATVPLRTAVYFKNRRD